MEHKKTNILRLANTVFQKVQKEKLFNSQNHLLIALSGGQDSALCLLVLFILKKKTIVVLDRKKILNFSKRVQNTERVKLTSQNFLQKKKNNCKTSLCKNEGVARTRTQNFVLHARTLQTEGMQKRSCACAYAQHLRFASTHCTQNFVLHARKPLCSKNKIVSNPLTNLPVTNYTLLWCNHFWQKETFFTMEHVSKLVFCKGYAMYFFAPVQAILSEKDARNWRHKVMQRSSLFLQPQLKECGYNPIELYYNFVSIIYSRNVIESKKGHAQILVHQDKGKGVFKHCCDKERYTFVEFTYLQKYISQQFCLYTNSAQDVPCQLQKNQMNAHAKAELLHPQWVKQGNSLYTIPRLEQLCVQGHTKSDRAESILFNLIKGTGMNGISTLQCKHTFLSSSNTIFYPIVFDFFKTIRIVCLQSHIFKKKKRINTRRSSLAMLTVLKQNFVLLRFLNTTSFENNSVRYKIKNYSKKLEATLFCQNSHVKTLYYQFKYKTKKL